MQVGLEVNLSLSLSQRMAPVVIETQHSGGKGQSVPATYTKELLATP